MNLSTVFNVGQRFISNDTLFTIIGFDDGNVLATSKDVPVRYLFTESHFFGRWADAEFVPETDTEEDVAVLKEKAAQWNNDINKARQEKQEALEKEKDAVAADPQYAHLTPYFSTWPVEAAKNIRKTLKKHYGEEVKFNVRVTHHTSITIKPSKKIDMEELDRVVKPYKLGSWNGMTDLYDYDDEPFSQVFGGVMYIILQDAD